jgi:nitroreductase
VAAAMLSSERLTEYVPTDPGTGAALAGFDSSVAESARVIEEAPCALFIENIGPFSGGRVHLVSNPATLGEAIIGYGFELIGIGAAIENMLLAAHALGLAAVFIGDVLIAEAEVKELLGFEGDLVGVISLGAVDRVELPSKQIADDRVVFHDSP